MFCLHVFILKCFWGLAYSEDVSTTRGTTTLLGSCGRWCWRGCCRGRDTCGTPLWQMNCKDTVEIWEVTLSLFLLFSNHFCSLETCLWFEDELWELCMFRRVVQVPWQAAPSRVNTETHGNRSGARASAQASHQAPADPWQQAHDRSDKPELRRYLLIRKDHDACTRERIPRGFLCFLIAKEKATNHYLSCSFPSFTWLL